MSRRHPVTNHAVVRWIERHDGICLDRVRRLAAMVRPSDVDDEILYLLATEYGFDVAAAVRADIMSRAAVAIALGCGASGVRIGRVRLVIVNGRVVTVRINTWDRRYCPAPREGPRPEPAVPTPFDTG